MNKTKFIFKLSKIIKKKKQKQTIALQLTIRASLHEKSIFRTNIVEP